MKGGQIDPPPQKKLLSKGPVLLWLSLSYWVTRNTIVIQSLLY